MRSQLLILLPIFVWESTFAQTLVTGSSSAVWRYSSIRTMRSCKNAASCDSFDPNDKHRIMNVIAASVGGIAGFNDAVRALLEPSFWESTRIDPKINKYVFYA